MNFARTSFVPFVSRMGAAALLVLSLAVAGALAQEGLPDAADLLPGGLDLQTARNFPAGEDPAAIVAADLDGDGDRDLVTANEAGQDVSVLLNAGDASLGEPGHFQVGDQPIGVAAADLDGDEDLDLATAHSGSPSISLLFNDSKGAYSPQATVNVGDVQGAIAAGDLDGDGDVELVVEANRLLILRNDGAGRFEEAGSWEMLNGFGSIAVADLDLDGRLDIAAGVSEQFAFWFLFNEGNGSYTPRQSEASDHSLDEMALGDVDGDSYLDLVSLERGVALDGFIDVLRNNGDRTFGGHASYEAGQGPTDAATGDLDEDGDDDIVAANFHSSDLSVVLSKGSESRGKDRRVTAGSRPHAVTLSDLDGDGHLDAAVANTGSDDVSIFVGSGDGRLPSADLFEATERPDEGEYVSRGVQFVFAGDFDGDADLDIMTLSESQGGYMRNNGSRSIDGASYMDAGGRSAATGDLDGDGDLDFASVSSFSRVYVQLNFGSGTFSEVVSHEAGVQPVWLDLGDLEGDGDLDIAAADRGGNAVSLLRNDGEGVFGGLRQFPAGPAPASLAAADLDGDGKPDIACANPGADAVTVLRNVGGGELAEPAQFAAGDDPRSIEAGDLDGDGDIDLATADLGSNTVSVLRNAGAGTFGPAEALDTGRSPVLVLLGDLEGDGDLEIVSANLGSSTVSVFVNAGSGTLEPGVQLLAGTDASSAGIADLDGDGRAEVFSANRVVEDDYGEYEWDFLAVIWNGAPQPVVIDDGDPGTAATGDWRPSGGADPYGMGSLYSKQAGATYAYTAALVPGSYEVFLWWTEYESRPTSVPVDIVHQGGTTTVYVNQRTDGGQWNSVGIYTFGSSATVTVRSTGNGSTCADAVRLAPVTAPPEIVIDDGDPGTGATEGWQASGGADPYGTGSLYSKQAGATYDYTAALDPGTYRVFLWWTEYASRPTSVPVDIVHQGGTTTVYVNQRTNGGQWNSVGVYTFGTSATITIRSLGNGSTCADAVRIAQATAPPPDETVIDDGDPGTAATGSWQASGGADPYGTGSLYSKQAGATYGYTAALSPGTYEVFLWWTEYASRPTSVPVDIVHQGGTTTVYVNQRTDGGQWNSVGIYTFGTSGTVTIRSLGNGSTCADAVRIVKEP